MPASCGEHLTGPSTSIIRDGAKSHERDGEQLIAVSTGILKRIILIYYLFTCRLVNYVGCAPPPILFLFNIPKVKVEQYNDCVNSKLFEKKWKAPTAVHMYTITIIIFPQILKSESIYVQHFSNLALLTI